MKKTIISAAFLTVSIFTFAQSNSHGPSGNNKEVSHLSITDFSNPEDAQKIVTEIMNVIGLKQNFILKPASVSNVEASVSKRKRYISYNPEFIGWINNSTKDKWASIALLAHEIGHHLNGHTLGSGGNSQFELEADEFAGFILNKLGASLEQSQRVMYYIAKVEKSETHPAREDRMLAIKNGWSKAVAPAATNSEMAINNQDSSQNVLSN
jgi:hypothetical protein